MSVEGCLEGIFANDSSDGTFNVRPEPTVKPAMHRSHRESHSFACVVALVTCSQTAVFPATDGDQDKNNHSIPA